MKILEKDQETRTEMEFCLSVDEVRFPMSGLPKIHQKVAESLGGVAMAQSKMERTANPEFGPT